MCGKKIGGERSHQLARQNVGARRLMNPNLVDNGNFSVGSLCRYPIYWECQKKYIEAEMFKMKKEKELTIKGEKHVFTGLNFEYSGRTSILTTKILKFFLDSIYLCLLNQGILKPDDAMSLFQKPSVEEVE